MNSKGFKAVAFMRERRAQIDEEDRGLTWEQRARKTLDLLRDDPLWNRLKSQLVETGHSFSEKPEVPPPKQPV